MLPLKEDFKSGDGMISIPAEFFNTIARILNTITVAPGEHYEINRTEDGRDWEITVPQSTGGGLEVLGTIGLYKTPIVRQYELDASDPDNPVYTLVPVGEEVDEAAMGEDYVYRLTYDDVRER